MLYDVSLQGNWFPVFQRNRGLEFCVFYTPEDEGNIKFQKNGILNHTTVKTSVLARL
jgi:hypothetical protein